MDEARQQGDVVDRIAIRELAARYNDAWEEEQPEAWAATFTTDGVLEIGGDPVAEGREALRLMLAAAGGGTIHMTTDAVIEVDGDRATHRCRLLTARPASETGDLVLSGIGRYTDNLVRTPDGWRFARRSAVVSAVADPVRG